MDFIRFSDHVFTNYPWIPLILAFVLGGIVGSFLNVVIYRLPYQKSVLWPGSHCGSCYRKIPWFDNLPMLSYWRLGGKCRYCGAAFSSRYFWIELLTGMMFAGLFWLEVMDNIRHVGHLPYRTTPVKVPYWDLVCIWLYHSFFFSLLMAATFTDIDHREIPLGITVPGTLVGIVGGALMPWPWPVDLSAVNWHAGQYGGLSLREQDIFGLATGVTRWPVWMPPPEWLRPGTWPMGLATSLAGALAGAVLMRAIRAVFSWGLGKEAMGLGDADLMMMIGAFLGWQALLFVLGFAVLLGLLYAILLILRNRGEFAFGPFLAGGAALTTIFSWYLGSIPFQRPFFDLPLILFLVAVATVLALVMTLVMRMLRLIGEAV